ncbi:MAG: hypothetical protein IKK71_00460 [Clostridia bacterium]|nr:hypothetical protein [Clostridia bacterium]
MDYTFAPLYVRIIYLILLGIVCSVIIYILTNKENKFLKIIHPTIIIVGFAIACSIIIYHLINPQIKTITCTYQTNERSGNLNPFSSDCVFLHNGEKLYIELDALTRKMVVENNMELKEGSTYTVTYEERENLILGIKK